MTTTPNIHQRLLKVMETVTYIQKDKKQGMNYTIVSHDKVTAKVRPALCEQGITYRPVSVTYNQNGNRTECHMVVRFTNADDPTDFIDTESFGYGVDSQDKGPGKAMSYAVKYALLKVLGLETGDDPDMDQSPSANHVDQSLMDLAMFEQDIDRMETPEDLQALLDKHTATIDQASKIDGARVSVARQKFVARRKQLQAA